VKTLLIAFLFCANLSAQIYNNTSVNTAAFDSVFKLINRDLNIKTDSLYIIVSDARFNRNIALIENCYATLQVIDAKNYNINLKIDFKSLIIKGFIHELIHIQQVKANELIIGKTWAWYNGEVYSMSSANKKFEIDANHKTELLYRKYRKEFKGIKKLI
jgi:hypothetical protein